MAQYDSAWLETMYNNRARVPEHAEHFKRWAADSAVARESQPSKLELNYGDGAGESLDVFTTAQKNAPVLVFIHGGWWRSLDKSDHSFVAPAFTAEGACVVLPNYALCPAVTIPEIVLQMVKALAWTWRNIAHYGGDPRRITVVGHSAGGHLAAMMLACDWKAVASDLPADLVKNALSISGLYELRPLMHTPSLQASLHLTPQDVLRASPASLPRPAKGQLFSVAGAEESDEFLRNNALIEKAWGNKTVPVCEAMPGLNHFSIVEAFAQRGHRLHAYGTQLLQNTVKSA
ncbi:MAG: alpha/beta hydrolase [Bdellovibrionales bacterium]|nr:alpha/beta hydrolase [Ramlibacter sp.]